MAAEQLGKPTETIVHNFMVLLSNDLNSLIITRRHKIYDYIIKITS